MIASLLAMLCAICFGASTMLSRRAIDDIGFFQMTVSVTFVGFLFFLALATLRIPHVELSFKPLLFFFLAGLFIPGLARLLFFKSVDDVGAVITSSVYATEPFFTTAMAIAFLGENLNLPKAIGIVAIVIGMLLMESTMHEGSHLSRRARSWMLLIPLIGTISASIGWILLKKGLFLCNEPIIGIAITYLGSLLIYLIAPRLLSRGLRTGIRTSIKDLRHLWKVCFFLYIGWLFKYYALAYGSVIVVIPLASTTPLFTLLFTYLWLRELEKPSLKLVLGAMLVVLGVALLVVL